MSKSNLEKIEFDNFVSEFVNFRNQAGGYFLKMAETIARAKSKMKPKTFKKFLKDPRVNLKRLQASKLITIYQVAKSDSRLAGFFNKEGVEKSYLITIIKDNDTRHQFIEIIENDVFTVKQTKQAVKLISDNQKTPSEAVETVKNWQTQPKPTSNGQKTIPFEKYCNLEANYKKVLAEKQELEEQLAKLSKNDLMPETKKPQESVLQGSMFDKDGNHKLSLSQSNI
jgi:hypothetical protein